MLWFYKLFLDVYIIRIYSFENKLNQTNNRMGVLHQILTKCIVIFYNMYLIKLLVLRLVLSNGLVNVKLLLRYFYVL